MLLSLLPAPALTALCAFALVVAARTTPENTTLATPDYSIYHTECALQLSGNIFNQHVAVQEPHCRGEGELVVQGKTHGECEEAC
jgi:hypothetical protein